LLCCCAGSMPLDIVFRITGLHLSPCHTDVGTIIESVFLELWGYMKLLGKIAVELPAYSGSR